MSVVLLTLGVLAAGVVFSLLSRGILDPLRHQPLAGVGVVIVLMVAVAFFVHAYETGSTVSNSTSISLQLTPLEAQQVADTSADNAFLTWARNTMVADTNLDHVEATYYIEPPAVAEEPELYQWSTYRLLPGRITGRLAEARWIVFYGVTPALTAYQRHLFDVMEFSHGYALATRTDGR